MQEHVQLCICSDMGHQHFQDLYLNINVMSLTGMKDTKLGTEIMTRDWGDTVSRSYHYDYNKRRLVHNDDNTFLSCVFILDQSTKRDWAVLQWYAKVVSF